MPTVDLSGPRRRPETPAARWTACAPGPPRCSAAPITTRPPARWPTSLPASAMRSCATTPPTAIRSLVRTRSSNAPPSPSPPDRFTLTPHPCAETDRSSWQTGSSRPRDRTPITQPALQQPLVPIGASRADSMSAWVVQNPPQMPDIRLQVIHPGKSKARSVLIYGGVHIGRVGRQFIENHPSHSASASFEEKPRISKASGLDPNANENWSVSGA